MEHRKRRNGPLELVTWLVRTGAPAALEGMGLGLVGGLLAEHEPIFDAKTTRSALNLVRIARGSLESLGLAITDGQRGETSQAMGEALDVLMITDLALLAALAFVMGAGSKMGQEIQDGCLRVQVIASRWGKDVPPPTIPSATDSERLRTTASSKKRGSSKSAGAASSKRKGTGTIRTG